MPIKKLGQKFVDSPVYCLPLTNVTQDMISEALGGKVENFKKEPLLVGHQRIPLKWVRYKMVNGVPIQR